MRDDLNLLLKPIDDRRFLKNLGLGTRLKSYLYFRTIDDSLSLPILPKHSPRLYQVVMITINFSLIITNI